MKLSAVGCVFRLQPIQQGVTEFMVSNPDVYSAFSGACGMIDGSVV
jgi:hypothetical protein